MKILLCDTNLFIHFKQLKEIPWRTLLQSDEIEILICPTVLRELEQQKIFNQRKHLRDRVDARIKQLATMVNHGGVEAISEGVTSKILPWDPYSIDFTAEKLNANIDDDWLIATVLQLKLENSQADVTIVTCDSGLKAKAFSKGIPFLEIPDSYKLPVTQDSTDKENERLRISVEKLRDRIPKLGIKALVVRPTWTSILQHVKNIYPLLVKPVGKTALEFDSYMRNQLNCGCCGLILKNEGNLPADDVEIILTFSKVFRVGIKLDDPPKSLSLPVPDRLQVSARIKNNEKKEKRRSAFIAPLEADFDGRSLKFLVTRAMHGKTLKLGPFYVWRADDKPLTNFTAECDMFCANLPKPVRGKKLNFVLPEINKPSKHLGE